MSDTSPVEAEPPRNFEPDAYADTEGGDYWYGLIDETTAAAFEHCSVRRLQELRQKGGGPPFIRLSSRMVRYRRIDMKRHHDERLRLSTSDDGQAAA